MEKDRFFSFLKRVCWVYFRFAYKISVEGEENIPTEGAVIIASNHPTYFDPLLLHLRSPRKIRFLAWDLLFKLPVISLFLRYFGAIPVNPDISPNPGAYKRSLEVLRSGGALGIFPEGGRTPLEEVRLGSFRSGFARLALLTGASVVPVAIVGAERVWPRFWRFPRFFGKITVVFHPPLQVERSAVGEVPRSEMKRLTRQVWGIIYGALVRAEGGKGRRGEGMYSF
ncbi:MAG: 1-acyl-sn-glycerol-3-phosphate acyltransferase [Planctomycetota bacterium]|nr:MAG: 1-acyl-sn-glycerol-3-phosphate acyltransferase [Planctomycetota bacterium]